MKTHRPYELKEYDPEWKEIFAVAAKKLEPLLGDNFVSVEHIGSTSIEGMVAKPQVDVLAVVKDLDRVEESYEGFRKSGFIVEGRGYVNPDDEYIHEDSPDGKRLVSVHILQDGNSKIDEYRIFRDYLILNREDRELYISTKRDLYAKYHDNYAEYDDGKRDLIQEIKAKAKIWADKK